MHSTLTTQVFGYAQPIMLTISVTWSSLEDIHIDADINGGACAHSSLHGNAQLLYIEISGHL